MIDSKWDERISQDCSCPKTWKSSYCFLHQLIISESSHAVTRHGLEGCQEQWQVQHLKKENARCSLAELAHGRLEDLRRFGISSEDQHVTLDETLWVTYHLIYQVVSLEILLIKNYVVRCCWPVREQTITN